jgi:hypothetical protein
MTLPSTDDWLSSSGAVPSMVTVSPVTPTSSSMSTWARWFTWSCTPVRSTLRNPDSSAVSV